MKTVPDNYVGNPTPATHVEAELQHLNATAIIAAEHERRLHHQVSRARFAGSSWARIATELGVSKQAAMKRFGDNHDCHQEQCGVTRTRFI